MIFTVKYFQGYKRVLKGCHERGVFKHFVGMSTTKSIPIEELKVITRNLIWLPHWLISTSGYIHNKHCIDSVLFKFLWACLCSIISHESLNVPVILTRLEVF